MSWKSSLRKWKSKVLGNKEPEPSVTDTLYLYTEEELERYEQFIQEQFGPYTSVFHEIYSPDIHLDVILVPPTQDSPYNKLITMGMGAYAMHIPDELEEEQLERAELVFYLPPTWDMNLNKEASCWPILQMKNVARVPIQYDTWIGYGHTFVSEECTPYAENTELCGLSLLYGMNNQDEPLDLYLGEKGKINFYQVMPLYKEELEYKLAYGMDALVRVFAENHVEPVLDLNRQNYGAQLAQTEGYALRNQVEELHFCNENNIMDFLQRIFHDAEEFVVLSRNGKPDEYIQAVQAERGIDVLMPVEGVLSSKICTQQESVQLFMDFFHENLAIEPTEFNAVEWA